MDLLVLRPLRARRRFPEAAMALASIFAVQQMEKYGMSINRNPSPFVDASSLEPTKRLNRFVSSMVVFASVRKVIASDSAVLPVLPGPAHDRRPADFLHARTTGDL
jgi:hypothetical protein